jgi:hypothetical protein
LNSFAGFQVVDIGKESLILWCITLSDTWHNLSQYRFPSIKFEGIPLKVSPHGSVEAPPGTLHLGYVRFIFIWNSLSFAYWYGQFRLMSLPTHEFPERVCRFFLQSLSVVWEYTNPSFV